MRSIFLDRDGVINENSNNHVKSWDEFTFLPHALTALRWLNLTGFRVFVVTNQAIVNRGLVSNATIEEIHARMIAQIELHGGRISAVSYCPHDNHEQCTCRKPQPGMLLDLAAKWQIDLHRTYMVGDALTDIAAAHAAGCTPVLVRTGRGMQQSRLPEIRQQRPAYIAPDLAGAVQWIFRQEWLMLPAVEYDPLQREAPYTAHSAIARPSA